MKKTWDDMVAAKQAERDRLRELEFDDSASDISTKEPLPASRSPTHVIPNIIIKTADDSDSDKTSRFVKHSPKSYAKVSKKLANEVFVNASEPEPAFNKSSSNEIEQQQQQQQQQRQEIHRQNWRNKEIRPRALDISTFAEPNSNNFTKTYSFRNLPKGRVAKLQQMFDKEGSPNLLNGQANSNQFTIKARS